MVDNNFYYHYTNGAGMKGIRESLTIHEGNSNVFGNGVYLTKLSPENDRVTLVENNFKYKNSHNIEKCNFAIKIEIGRINAQKCNDRFYRNVYKHDGNIDLTSIPFEIIQVGGMNRTIFSHLMKIPTEEVETNHDSSNGLSCN